MDGKQRMAWVCCTAILCAWTAQAEWVGERWGAKGRDCTYPGALTVEKGPPMRLVFDLSALPKGARISRALISNFRIQQPNDPILIYAADRADAKGELADGAKPLQLIPPWFRAFDATEAVRRCVKRGEMSLALIAASLGNFDPNRAYLEIWYEGEAKNTPPQVTDLKVVTHDGQAFVTWKELPQFVPPKDQIRWVCYEDYKTLTVDGPGKSEKGRPHVAGIRLAGLRAMQKYKVINPPKRTQKKPKLVRTGPWPEIRYRVYRSTKKITPETIHEAEPLGAVGPLVSYDMSMLRYKSWGEYYDKREVPDNFIPTYCLEDSKSIPPGHAFYVHTTGKKGNYYYAVTSCKNGTENLGQVTSANSLAAPVKETEGMLAPVKQYRYFMKYYKHQKGWKCYFWPAPPLCNIPHQHPKRISVIETTGFKAPGPLIVMGGDRTRRKDVVAIGIQEQIPYGGRLCYNSGLYTLRAFRKSPVDYFSEKYNFHLINWMLSKYEIDRDRIEMGASTHFCLRHPEIFKILRSGPYEIDFDRKWNPSSGSLGSRLGPKETARTVDGHKAWDVFDISWYLQTFQNRDIPFFVATHGGKESGHAVEYGFQDDPKGWAALRDGRQPHVGAWGGSISRDVRHHLQSIRWNKSVPAFSNCSLDSNPGNGDPSDGDPWGQINGYLLWDYDSIVDEPDRWEMTVFLARDAFQTTCTVDLTPRHRKKFNPKLGEKFKWTNTDVQTKKVVQSGDVTIDKWGLATLKDLTVGKGRNRISIGK